MGARELSGFLFRRVFLRPSIHDYRAALLSCESCKLLKFLTSAVAGWTIPDKEQQDCARGPPGYSTTEHQQSRIDLAHAAFWCRSMFNGSGYFRSSDPDLWNHSFRPHHTAQSSLSLTVTTNPMVRLTLKAMTRFSIVSAD
ncbi:hypothetical protein ABKN59_001820 [Abortiporus biennis]